MHRTAGWLLLGIALALAGGCRSTPRESQSQPAPAQCSDPQLESLATYAVTLRQGDEAALLAEKSALEGAPPSSERDLRLALLLAQHNSPAYDPEGAARLLAQVSSSTPPADHSSKALAEVLSASLAGTPRNCTDTEEFRDLTWQLGAEQQKRQEIAGRLESTRQELDAERAQRAKLEQQLDALKSLEEQIKNRDNGPGR